MQTWNQTCVILYRVCGKYFILMELWTKWGPSWSSSYGSWIYNYLCNQCLSPPTFLFRIPLRRGVLDTTLGDKVCQWLAAGRWVIPGTPVSSTNKTDRHDITEILLKVMLNTWTKWTNLSTLKGSNTYKNVEKNIILESSRKCVYGFVIASQY